MHNKDYRTNATIAIWIIFGIIVGLSTIGQAANLWTAIIVTIAAIAAIASSAFLWVFGDESRSRREDMAEEKAKRGGQDDARMELLLRLLDRDEREALKQRLIDDLEADGEALSLAELLAEQEEDAARRS